MNSVLVLLGLLSLATLASRRGGTAAFLSVATAPLLLGVGLLISPQGLGFMLPSLLQGVAAPLHVAVAWLALLVGMRGQRPPGTAWLADTAWLVVWMGVTFATTAAAAWVGLVALHAWDARGDAILSAWTDAPTWALLGAALVVGTGSLATATQVAAWPESPLRRRLLFLARHDDVLGALALLVAPMLMAPTAAWMPTALAALTGVMLAVCALLMGAASRANSTQGSTALVALVVVAGGMCSSAGLPEAPSAFLMGTVLALTGVGGRVLGEDAGQAYDRPVRLAVLLLAGSLMQVSVMALVLGVALLGGRLLGKTLVALTASKAHKTPVSPKVILASAGITVPFAVSLLMTGTGEGVARAVFSAVVLCVCFTDLLSFAWSFSTWVQDAKARAITVNTLPAVVREAA